MEERKITQNQILSYRQYLIREEKSTATVEKYLRDVRAFVVYVGNEVVTKEIVMAYKKYLQMREYAVRSINSMLASLNSLLDFLGWADCRVKAIKQQKQVYCAEEQELTKAEYMRLLDAAKRKPQLQLVMKTICGTGIRVSELRCFTVENVARGEVTVNCKGKTRTVLIPGKLRKLLLDYARKEKIRSGVIFLTRSGKPLNRSRIWAQMKALCEQAGVEAGKVFPHNLRKLFARTFYGIEKDIAKLADILGHSSINTTRIYIMTTGVEHRRKIERLGLVI
ncbi:MAG: tyrosine-type recombinase/integrase [Firmicutes bacterium]|nr:tyrosine-type recombinase/integrase [Bacillota bacterium]